MRSVILRDLDQAVVGTGVQKTGFHRRFREHRDISVERGGDVLIDRVRPPEPSHHGNFIAIEVTRQVAADELPCGTAIISLEDPRAGKIQTRMRVRTDDERRVPVPALRHLAFAFLRLYAKAFTGLAIKAHQITVLRLSVNSIRIFRINQRAEAVTSLGYEPVLVVDARSVFGPRGSAE